MTRPLHLAVALDGAGWHPEAWRLATARPAELLTAGYWADLVATAERGLLDLVTIEDALTIPPSRAGLAGADPAAARPDTVRGRLDAVLIAARVAPTTRHVGIVPTATVTHTEPFHLSKALATLDYVSTGRAGWQVKVTPGSRVARQFGRRELADLDVDRLDDPAVQQAITDLFAEAGDAVEVVRRLWDSWEDDAEIRDAATGRFIDRDKLHYIDFEGRWFSVRGPSITPRPPQGQPLVTALAHAAIPRRFAAEHADVVFVTPFDDAEARAAVDDVVAHRPTGADAVHVLADLVVLLDAEAGRAQQRWDELTAHTGRTWSTDAAVFVGTPGDLADLLITRQASGLSGYRLRPAALPQDLDVIVEQLVPELQRRGAFRTAYESTTLRERFGLARPVNRYAAA